MRKGPLKKKRKIQGPKLNATVIAKIVDKRSLGAKREYLVQPKDSEKAKEALSAYEHNWVPSSCIQNNLVNAYERKYKKEFEEFEFTGSPKKNKEDQDEEEESPSKPIPKPLSGKKARKPRSNRIGKKKEKKESV